jgi:hypothetical protein
VIPGVAPLIRVRLAAGRSAALTTFDPDNTFVSEKAGGPVLRIPLLTMASFILTTTIGNAQRNDFLTTAPEPTAYAWWLRTEFHPFELQVRGIPIGNIRPTWCKATEFRKDLFPPELASDLDSGDGLSFAVDGFFDESKIKQTALTGVYELCSGERGTFLLILAWPQNGPPIVRYVRELPREHQFAMLNVLPDFTIVVFYCVDCDHIDRFKWDKRKKAFVLLPPISF